MDFDKENWWVVAGGLLYLFELCFGNLWEILDSSIKLQMSYFINLWRIQEFSQGFCNTKMTKENHAIYSVNIVSSQDENCKILILICNFSYVIDFQSQ